MALLEMVEEGACDLVVAFGGQGVLSYFDELRALHQESVGLVKHVCEELTVLAQECWHADVNFLDLLEDLGSPLTREELMAPPISCPLIALCQLATFWKHCGPCASKLVSKCHAIVGHSQGLASALLIAACTDDNFEKLCMDLCKYLFFQGLRSQEVWIKGDWTESAMMSVMSPLPQLKEILQDTQGVVSLACVNGPTRHVVCGNQTELQDFADEHQLKHKLLDIAVPFHSSNLQTAVDLILTDIEKYGLLKWMNPKSLKTFVPAADNGEDLRGVDHSIFIRRVVELQLTVPNDWPQCLNTILSTAQQRLQNRRDDEDIKVSYVLDMGPCGDNGIRGISSFTQFLTNDIPVQLVATNSWVSTVGKVGATVLQERDRAALPVPFVCQSPAGRVDGEPADDLEAALLEIFRHCAPKIRMHSQFLASGVDSLAIVRVLPSVVQLLPEITVADILTAGSIAKTAELGKAKMAGLEPILLALPPIPTEVKPLWDVELTLQQEQMWALYQLEPMSARYNEARLYSVADLDVKSIKIAIEQLCTRHQQLQTTFYLDERGIPMQRVLTTPPTEILEVCTTPQSIPEAVEMAHTTAMLPFRLEAGKVWRVLCIQTESKWLILLAMHHIIMDGWSLPIILRDLAHFYNGQTKTAPLMDLPALDINYHTFALWQLDMRQGPWVPHHIERWQNVLSGASKLELPLDSPKPRKPTYAGASVKIEGVDLATSCRLREVGINDGASVFVVLLTAWFWILSRLCRQTDMTVGVPYAGRDAPQLHDVVGYFVNVLPVRVDLEKETSFMGAMLRTKCAVLEAISLGAVPFIAVASELVQESAADFKSLFVLREDEMKPVPWETGNDLCPVDMPVLGAKSDLVVVVREASTQESYEGRIEFSTECFTVETVQRLACAYNTSLKQVAAKGLDVPLNIQFATDDEVELQLKWSMPDVDVMTWSKDVQDDLTKTIDVTVFAHGENRPKDVAVVAPDAQLTWADLVQGAQQVAFAVQKMISGTGSLIGIMIEPSQWMAVATLGIWHAGHGYMPMDPGQPDDRLQFIVENSGMKLLLCMQKYHEKAKQVCDVVSVLEELKSSQDIGNSRATMDGIAYAIYTSGSTGKPKGVPITHLAALTHVAFCASLFKFDATDVGVQSASFMFDAHVLEMWPLLYSGTRCIIAAKDSTKDLESFSNLLVRHRCSWTFFVPSVLTEILNNFKLPDTLKTIVVGGEATSTQLCSRILANDVQLINMYGPTEVAVASTSFSVTSMEQVPESCIALPIGRPCAWRVCWVLDDFQQLSLSRVGELFISGEGMSTGYINLPQKSAATFLPTPAYLSGGSPKMYKSGDLVRWLPTGHIDFLGRLDFQVKLRGLRIELGEIENVIRQVEMVTEALVIVKGEHLIGYYSGTASEELVFGACRQMLPVYMVPAVVMHLATWPRGRTGKIDRLALPEPAFDADESDEDVPPEGDFEAQLHNCFSVVLHRKKFNVTKSFFDAGGTSLKAASLLAMIRKQTKMNITFGDFYVNPSVRQLANFLRSNKDSKNGVPQMLKFEESVWEAEVPCSFGQEQMLTLYEMSPSSPAYNCPILLQINGHLNVVALSKAFNYLVQRHDSWRANVDRDDEDSPVQCIYSPTTFECPMHFWDGHQLRSISSPDKCKPRQRKRQRSRRDMSPRFHPRRSSSSQGTWAWSPNPSRLMSDAHRMDSQRSIPQRRKSSRDFMRPRSMSSPLQEDTPDFFRPQDPPGKSFEALHAWLKHEMYRPFDLRGEPLIRVIIAWFKKGQYLLLFNMHHAVFDGTSLGTFSRELREAYKAFAEKDAPPNLEQPQFQYLDYAIWQRSLPATTAYAQQCKFWEEELRGATRLQLPTDGIDTHKPDGTDSGDVKIIINANLTHQLRAIAKECGTTMYTLLLATYAVLLGRYSGSNDVVLGSAWSGRDSPETATMVGYFVNTLLLRVPLQHCSFTELLSTCHNVVMKAFNNAVVPYVEVLKTCNFTQNMVVADFAFADESWSESGVEDQFQLANLDVKVLDVMSVQRAKFDLSLELAETTFGELSGKISYNAALFKPERINRMVEHMQTLLACFAQSPECDVLRAPLLSGKQMDTVSQWSHGECREDAEFNHNRVISDLFSHQVSKTPKALALLDFKQEVTYATLDSLAEHLGHKLQALGVQAEVMVGLLQKRSVNLVASLWAVLKAGGAYVPIDPDYPPDRVVHILEDTCPVVLMTSRDLFAKDKFKIDTQPMFVQDELNDWESTMAQTRIQSSTAPNNLAYVVFSSGSTGKPKGSLVEHRMLVNETLNQIQWMELGPGDRVLQFHNPAFDGSIPELVSCLCSGAGLVLWTDNFAEAITQLHVNKLTMTPSALSVLDDSVKLDVLGTGAEALPLSLAQTWAKKTKMWNFYGPSECTVDATATRVNPNASVIHIGRPIPNCQAYILSPELMQQPQSVPGELCIAGVQVARGYLNRDDLTKQKFIQDPFGSGRLYRTGDVVQWMHDGNIEFKGRSDFQVKVRGFRIELGEIEVALQQNGCRTCVTMVEEQQIVAFVTPQDLDTTALKSKLGATLPPYFVPSRILCYDELPRTQNGKFDREALKQILANSKEDVKTTEIVPPRNGMEQRIMDQVKEVLKLEQLSIRDNLKLAGMTSLHSMRLVTKLRAANIDVSLQDLYQIQCIEELTDNLQQLRAESSFAGSEIGFDSHPTDLRRRINVRQWGAQLIQRMCQFASYVFRSIMIIVLILLIAAVVMYPAVPPVYLIFKLNPEITPWKTILLVGVVGWPLYVLGLMVALVLFKWLVVGCYKEGKVGLDSFQYLRWWAVDRAMTFANDYCLSTVRGGTCYYIFLRLLGVRAKGFCLIETAFVSEFDLVELGEGCVICSGVRLRPGVIEDELILRRICLGAGVLVGEGSVVLGGGVAENGVRLRPMSLLSGRDPMLARGTEWHGSPLQPLVGLPIRNTPVFNNVSAKLIKYFFADIVALMLVGLVFLGASQVFYICFGACMRAFVITSWTWWEDAIGFQLSAVAFVFGPVITPYCDLYVGTDDLVGIDDKHGEREILKKNLLLQTFVALVIAYTVMGITMGILSVVVTRLLNLTSGCYREGYTVSLLAGRGEVRRHLVNVLLRTAWGRFLMFYNGTRAMPVWLKLLGARCGRNNCVALTDLSDPSSISLGDNCVLNQVSFSGASPRLNSNGVWVRQFDPIEIRNDCFFAGGIVLPRAVVEDGTVVGGSAIEGHIQSSSIYGSPPLPTTRTEFATDVQRIRHGGISNLMLSFCHLLYPILLPAMMNMALLLALIPAMLIMAQLTDLAHVDSHHYATGIAFLPPMYLALGVCVGVVAIPLKWLILFRDAEEPSNLHVWPWYPLLRLKYYRHLLAQWIHMMALATFMSLMQGTPLYSLWLKLHGVDVALDAKIFTALCDFDLISIGSKTVVGRDAQLSGRRVLPCADNTFVESKTKVVIGPRCTLGEVSSVICAEVKEMAVVGALTGVGPDMQLPSRSLAIGAPPWRYAWQRHAVKQLDPSELTAPELDVDIVLPHDILSELHKSQRKHQSSKKESCLGVFVTGAAGFLGRYVVHALLQIPDVIVFAVSRSKGDASGHQRLVEAMRAAKLHLDDETAKRLEVQDGDIGKNKFGLNPQKYLEMCDRVAHVYHIASRVNHAEPYENLKPDNVQGTLNMLQFAVTKRLKNFHYISTIGTITPEMADSEGYYPEKSNLGHIRMGNLVGSCEITGGYAYSKWVAEKIVNLAFERGVPGSVWRPGIIGGCSRDGYSGDDNFVHLMKDMITIGFAPRVLGSQFNITPVDFVGHALASLIKRPTGEWSKRTFHPIARGSDLDMITIYEELVAAGYPLTWTSFHSFRNEIKTRFADAIGSGGSANEFKSWLLVGALSSEGQCLDATARTDRSWKLMQSAPNADTWSPRILTRKMIEHLIAIKKFPPPPSMCVTLHSEADTREDMRVPLVRTNGAST